MNIEQIQIGTISKFINGYAFKPTDWEESGYKIIRIQNLTNSSKSYNYSNKELASKYIVKKGDILVAWSATIDVFEWKGEDAYLNQHIFKVEFDHTKVDKNYFKLALKKTINELSRLAHGATMKHITKKKFETHKIPLPNTIEDQKKIANLLSQIETLIIKRKKTIELLDNLVKNTFLDMFGDPVVNPKNWETKTIEQIVKEEKHSIKRGPFGGSLKKEIFVDDGYLVYEQFHALNNDFSMARYFIDEEKFNELKAFEVVEGDIIISCSGIYLGKLAVIPKGAKQGIINQALLKVSLDNNKMNHILFINIFTNENFRNKFFANNRGAGVPNFPPMKDFKKFQFISPPKNLQDKFATIAKKIETTKKIYQNSLNELHQLFDSVSQKAFKGELDFKKNEKKFFIAKQIGLNPITLSQNLKLEGKKDFSKNSLIEDILEQLKPKGLTFTQITQYFKDNNYYDIPYDEKLSDIANKMNIKDIIFELLKEEKLFQIFDRETKQILLGVKKCDLDV